MYTAIKLGDTIDAQKGRRIITVQFTEGEKTFVKDFQFDIASPLEVLKKTVKAYLDEINFVAPELPDGEMDLTITPPAPVEPTAAELAHRVWKDDFAKLEKVLRLIDCGVLTGNEPQVVALRDKVKADFKPAYL